MKTLRISSDFALPIEAATQAFGILAVRGVGKTYLSKVMIEEMLQAGIPVVVADPVGVYWGLRASANGKDPGLPIVIFGGDHADVPLEVTSGEFIANLIIKEKIPSVLDLSHFRKGEQKRFMTDFCERLYHKNRDALHLFLDEADEFAPQRPQKGAERLLGAIEDLVRRGRARGIGITLITQRAAVLNKNVLTQISVLVCMRSVSPQDRNAVDEWVKVYGSEDKREAFMDSLPSLPIGTAWIWSPGWLDIFKKVKIRTIKTFDSSATPKVGEKIRTPKNLAEIDLSKIREQMASTIEKSKQEDPRELRREVSRLNKELLNKVSSPDQIESVKKSLAKDFEQEHSKTVSLYENRLKNLRGIIGSFQSALKTINKLSSVDPTMSEEIENTWRPPTPKFKPALTEGNMVGGNGFVKKQTTNTRPIGPPPSGSPSNIHGGERKILIALAQYPEGRTKNQVAILSGYAQGGAFFNYLSSLRTKGFIEGKDTLTITQAGLEALGSYERLPEGSDLFDYWKAKLAKAERSILDVLREKYPQSLDKETLAVNSGYALGGGYFNALSKLRTLGLIDGKGELKLSENLVD